MLPGVHDGTLPFMVLVCSEALALCLGKASEEGDSGHVWKTHLLSFRESFIAERGKLAGMRSVPRHSGLVPLGDQNVLWLAHCTIG